MKCFWKRPLTSLLGVATALFAIRSSIQWLRRGKNKSEEDKDTLRLLYFETGLQYQVAARYAAFARFIPVCGSLFHHAIEMYLKGYFCQSLDESERKRLKHNLKKTWRRFKTSVSDSSLDKFDALISALDKHEEIRYPEKIAKHGMTAYILFTNSSSTVGVASPQQTQQQTQPEYKIIVDELDALSKIIFDKSRVNPKGLTVGLNKYAQDFLNRENKSPLS